MASKILIIDDDARFTRMVAKILRYQGYETLTAGSGQEGLRLMYQHRPDLVLLDVIMPRMNGWQTCERIREMSDVPVIILTGDRVDEDDVAYGLDRGADDYLIKPVGNKELAARVRAILRRASLSPTQCLREGVTYDDGRLGVNIARRQVTVNGKRVRLSPREFRLFSLLIENAGLILSHQQLLERVWGWEYTDDIDYVRIYISHLRRKIEAEPSTPKYILTETGIGYYFQKQSEY
ncbi:MAG: response regulator transcription factor [Dehalococcoidales bacterium]|nr:response regulator transcription factor [Dehalococcoidales bacterium]